MNKEQEKQRSLDDFKNPPAWPYWPYQTIKRRKADGSMPDCALLVDFGTPGQGSDVHFLDASMFDLADKSERQRLLEVARSTPAIDAEKLIAEGWVID